MSKHEHNKDEHTTADSRFMRMALDLARNGIGSVEPNPAVGCVLVKHGQVIGRGYHKAFGGPHAEVEALSDADAKKNSVRRATAYVTLEPCCHHGKTPPCTDALIEAGVSRVVVAVRDNAPHVAGNGIKALRSAGVSVTTGVLADEAMALNWWFFHYHMTGRPWVICKWAQSIDGKCAFRDSAAHGQWITNAQSRKDVHKTRRRCQAVLVGVGTVITDDPELTARPALERYPARVVLDSSLRTPLKSKLLRPADNETIIITTEQAAKEKADKLAELEATHAKVAKVTADADGKCDLGAVLKLLGKLGMSQMLVEGGPTVHAAFLKAQLANELNIYIAPKILGRTGTADISKAVTKSADMLRLKDVNTRKLGNDTLVSAICAI
ncbi:Riboflavin biosynthesis protein RibD [Anaerohalosphaera lusitana]|uniref:Riboflavin biosynthesis protein RibD n=1 Tax=Anaerohalosphaera lusitana TaxID=1936003 RepID=A0A1U9NHK1_9BACT|nr:bifunctional diaminohydroxyphosphoribosylaminopyrimidine deaminase/5-amino-6-(5-phosphoribosylamino)uracil reductase RibD [Anaerohalosphaera lusitana]AQT67224.1 Riboflavin biosynthesis protein RibD [Anaerohalosphaera lusitana]